MTNRKPRMTRSAFDAQESALRNELKARLDTVEPIGRPPGDTDVWDRVLPLDSKVVVIKLRPVVKKRLGALFPVKFVQNGGYKSTEEVLDHLMPQLRNWCPRDVAIHIESSANVVAAAPALRLEVGDGR